MSPGHLYCTNSRLEGNIFILPSFPRKVVDWIDIVIMEMELEVMSLVRVVTTGPQGVLWVVLISALSLSKSLKGSLALGLLTI